MKHSKLNIESVIFKRLGDCFVLLTIIQQMFIWGNSSQKIKHETLYMDYKNDALNICLKFVILPCSWAK